MKSCNRFFSRFTPQLFLLRKNYSTKLFIKDAAAGVIVSIIALPLSIAFALASGVTPEIGLITAFSAGLIAALFTGCRFQVTGPTGALSVTIISIVKDLDYGGLLAASFLGGLITILFGALGIGKYIKYISKPVVIGFTASIALAIFTSQFGDFISITPTAATSGAFYHKRGAYFSSLDTINISGLCVGLGCLAVQIVWKVFKLRFPSALIVAVLSSLIVLCFDLDVVTIGEQFGELEMDLQFHKPNFSNLPITKLIRHALTLALLGSIVSLMSSACADDMTTTITNNDAELISQGLANMASSLLGGIPVTGAIARTTAIIKNGGVSPLAAIIHSLVILIAGLFLMPLIEFIPLAALASILIMVCYNMLEIRELSKIFKTSISDILLFIITLVFSVLFSTIIGILAGIGLSLVIHFVAVLRFNKTLKKPINIEMQNGTIKIKGVINFITIHKIRQLELPHCEDITIDMSEVKYQDLTAKTKLSIWEKSLSKKYNSVTFVNLQNPMSNALTKKSSSSNCKTADL